MDENNRLYLIVKKFCSAQIDLSPARITNLQMGYLFEELVRKFNEQANEEAGDHFTSREVIRLMVSLIFTEESEVYKPGIYRTIYDPTAGTGGMLSVAEEYIKAQNPNANLALFGQEYNPESFAICCSDLLIKDEPIDNLIYGDTLGIKESKSKGNNFEPRDGHPDKRFHYMLANPPFGVEWKAEEDYVKHEHNQQGFSGPWRPGSNLAPLGGHPLWSASKTLPHPHETLLLEHRPWGLGWGSTWCHQRHLERILNPTTAH